MLKMKEISEEPGYIRRVCTQMSSVLEKCAKDKSHCACTISIDDGKNQVGEPKLMLYCSGDKKEIDSMEKVIEPLITVEPVKIIKK